MRVKTGARVIVGCLLVVAAVVVCGVAKAAAQEVTPKRVVMAFYTAAYQSDDETYGLMAAPLAEKVKKSGGVQKFVADRSGGVRVQGVQILKEDVAGQTAVVSYLLHLVDGTVKKVVDNLVVEGGHWKITVPPAATKK